MIHKIFTTRMREKINIYIKKYIYIKKEINSVLAPVNFHRWIVLGFGRESSLPLPPPPALLTRNNINKTRT